RGTLILRSFPTRRSSDLDLGTTNSLVAAVRNGIAVVLNDHDGHALLPSIVRYLRDGGVAVGREAEAEQARDPRNTIVSVKRFMRSEEHTSELQSPCNLVC